MINRYRGTCDSCEKQFVFRAVVPLATTEAFRFCCPKCKVELRAGLVLDYTVPRMDITPIGFKLDMRHDTLTSPVVTVATDLPVHRTKHVNILTEGGSPFLTMTNEMGDAFLSWRTKVDALQLLRSESFPFIRQLVDYLRRGNLDEIKKCLEQTLSKEIKNNGQEDAIYSCNRIIATFYVPLIEIKEMERLLSEYYVYLNNCSETKKEKYVDLLEEIAQNPKYLGFRAKSLATYLRVLESFDAFIVGLLYNEMPDGLKGRINEFRVFRDDYSLIKGLYQDLFELSSQMLIFLGSVVNLSKRDDPWTYVTGQQTYDSFEKKTAFERFKILIELPLLEELFGEVSRPMRNSIGHFNADYECSTGNLRYDDGTQKNYIEFLGVFYSGVKALWFILIIIEKFDIDMTRSKIEIPFA